MANNTICILSGVYRLKKHLQSLHFLTFRKLPSNTMFRSSGFHKHLIRRRMCNLFMDCGNMANWRPSGQICGGPKRVSSETGRRCGPRHGEAGYLCLALLLQHGERDAHTRFSAKIVQKVLGVAGSPRFLRLDRARPPSSGWEFLGWIPAGFGMKRKMHSWKNGNGRPSWNCSAKVHSYSHNSLNVLQSDSESIP